MLIHASVIHSFIRSADEQELRRAELKLERGGEQLPMGCPPTPAQQLRGSEITRGPGSRRWLGPQPCPADSLTDN